MALALRFVQLLVRIVSYVYFPVANGLCRIKKHKYISLRRTIYNSNIGSLS